MKVSSFEVRKSYTQMTRELLLFNPMNKTKGVLYGVLVTKNESAAPMFIR